MVDAIPLIGGKRGHPRRRPVVLIGDKGYDSYWHRVLLLARGIEPQIAHRRTNEDRSLGVWRWVIERTIAWLHQNRRLRVRYERRADIHQAFLTLGAVMITWRFLENGL